MKDYSTTRKLRCPSAGVYMTTLTPGANTQEAIARNNYDGRQQFWERQVQDGKVDCAFRLSIPENRAYWKMAISGWKLVSVTVKTRQVINSEICEQHACKTYD